MTGDIGTTVVEMRFRSHLYGTATPASDTDLKRVHHPSSMGSGITVMPAPSSAARTACITGTAVGSSPWTQKVWISAGILR